MTDDPTLDAAQLLADVDPASLGRRIKLARVRKELTQGDLAGDSASVGYISRIESGQRRPDISLLEIIAKRLSTSAIALLSGSPDPTEDNIRVALDHADLSLRGGATSDAGATLERIWPALETDAGPELRRRWWYLRALTWEASGLMEEAISALENLLVDRPDALEAARCAVALSRCYRETGDLARAIDVGDLSLQSLREQGLDGADEAIQLIVTTAAAHFQRGDVAHAVRICRGAIERAEESNSPVAMASAYWNASIMEHEQGRSRAAVSLAGKALQLLESAESNRNLARLRSELGIFQLRLDPPDVDSARANFEAAAEQFEWSGASPVDQARNKVALARAKLIGGDPEGAYADAVGISTELRATAPFVVVGALVVMGQAAFERHDPDTATAHYRDAVAVLSSVGSDRAAADSWFELGAMLDELGLTAEAHDAYRNAAVSTGLVSLHAMRRPAPNPR